MAAGSRFRQFFLTYLLFSVIIILIAAVAYGYSYRVIRESAVESGLRDLEYSTRILEARLDDVFTTISQLGSTSEIAQVAQLQRPLPYPDYYDVIRFQETIPRFNITSTFVDNLYVYFFRSQIVVSLSQMVMRLPFFFDEFLADQAPSFAEWDQELRSTLYRRTLLPSVGTDGSDPFIRIVESYPLDSIRPSAVIIVTVTEERFMSYLASLSRGEQGFVAAFRNDGGLLASSGNRETLDRFRERGSAALRRFVVLESGVERYDLNVVAAIPNALFFDQVNLLGSIFLTIVVLEILIGIILGRRFALRDMLPIQRLLEAVADSSHEPESKDEFEFLANSFSNMVRRNNTLQEAVQRQAPVVRSTFVDHLLTNMYSSDAEIESAMELAGLEFDKPAFAVAIVSVRRESKTNEDEQRFSAQPIVQAVLEEQWRSTIKLQAIGSNIEPGSIVFLINLEALSDEVYRKRMDEIIVQLQASFESLEQVQLLITVSDIALDLAGVPARYRAAKSVHDYRRTAGESGPIFASELADKLTNRALFDLETETVLSRSIVAGNEDKTRRLLSELRVSVETARGLAPHSIELLLEQLEGALLRTLGAVVFSQPEVQSEARTLLAASRTRTAFQDRFDGLVDAFLYLCGQATSASDQKHARLVSEMKRFVETNYADSQLGLSMVAESFRLSPGYVSRFFKEHAGLGLAEYIERHRIGRAMEILVAESDPISEIAVRVGYTSPNTFYKAFRRITGVSAGEYRQHGSRQKNPPGSPISTAAGTGTTER